MQALNQFLENIEPELHELVREVDALVRKAAPDLVASLKWGNLTYKHARNVCSMVAHGRYINLQVWGGAAISDPHGLLVGTGKSMRHLKIEADQAFNRSKVAAIVRAAAKASRARPRPRLTQKL